MKVAVLLAGSGVYDGSEIHESVFSLLALSQLGVDVQCLAPNRAQHHVVNHITGKEMPESRNVLIEAARIARGAILDLNDADVSDYDALIIPGGFGAAKNLNQWALSGPEGLIHPEVKAIVKAFVTAQKPICGLCMGPTVIVKALEGSGIQTKLTVGSSLADSPYDIAAISNGMQSIGAEVVNKTISEIQIDTTNKIVTAPCYMMEASIAEVHDNIQQAIKATIALI